jgi:hypothetical protein
MTKNRYMERKLLLYIGILLLVSGIALKSFTGYSILAWLTIGTGALAKILYIIGKIKSRSYKPGYEMICLYLGLSIFFTGMYVKADLVTEHKSLFIYTGIGLKSLFVFLFIRKMRSINK